MALTAILISASFIAIASAGYPGWSDSDEEFPGFPSPMMPPLRFGHLMPSFPGMPPFPPIPSMYSLFSKFPSMPPFPSPQDIVNTVPANGGSYNGIVVSTKSEMKRNEDGTLVKKGGSTILVNNDGKIEVKKIGDSPPDIVANPRPSFGFDAPKHKPKLHKFKNFKYLDKLNDFDKFDHFNQHFEPIDPAKIKNTVPGEGESFRGHVVSSHSHYSNVNGDVKQGGSVTKLENDNGKVKEEIIVYHNGGK